MENLNLKNGSAFQLKCKVFPHLTQAENVRNCLQIFQLLFLGLVTARVSTINVSSEHKNVL